MNYLSQFIADDSIEQIAQKFAKQIVDKGVFPIKKKKRVVSQELQQEYQMVDMDSMEQLESKSIGGEWLIKQALDLFKIGELLKAIGMNEKESVMAQQLLTAKILHPSSELETERWLQESSGALELYPVDDDRPTTRYRLYKAATHMYKHKDEIEKHIYTKTYDIFSGRSKIIIYDLTNMYFEGQMRLSNKAAFGRSKEKRYDCRLVGFALAIDSMGFLRYNKVYPGNISEPKTFKQMIDDVEKQFDTRVETPMVVMDAGISTEENLELLKQRKYDYVCVSRIIPKEYSEPTKAIIQLKDNRGHNIAVEKVLVKDKEDAFLKVKSEQKQIKEDSINQKLTQGFVERMTHLNEGLSIPRRTKKITAVHETVGRIKDQYSRIAKLYKITYQEDTKKGVVTDIQWEKQKEREKPKGEYFLRYSKKELQEKEIWDIYNLTREVEACFRILKTDLNIRPIHHQKDAYIEPHIWLGIVGYQIVNYIRIKLKKQDINYSWSTVVEKMRSQQISLVSVNAKESEKIYTKLVTRPTKDQKRIYDALGFKNRPFIRKTKVVPQM